MRFATFAAPSATSARLGMVQGEDILDLGVMYSRLGILQRPTSMLGLIHGYSDFQGSLRQIEEAAQGRTWREVSLFQDAVYALKDVVLYAPIPRPQKNIMCVGLNYREHVAETANLANHSSALPEHPVIFTKAPTALNYHQGIFQIDYAVSVEHDYEAELAVIIGKTGKNIPVESALDHVFGYTILNDITARDLQARHKQYFKGKSLDGSSPMGPVIVPRDEVPDPQGLGIQLHVNDELRQRSTTALMIFPVADLIARLSAGMTLEAGDIIATGTPSGVGAGRSPQLWLQPGDVVDIDIERIGRLTTYIR